MRWAAGEPTPFSRCAHSSVPVPALGAGAAAGAGAAGASGSAAQGGSGSGGGSSPVWAPEEEVGAVLVYGGFSGGSVEGDVLRIDGKVSTGGKDGQGSPWGCMEEQTLNEERMGWGEEGSVE